MCDPSRVVIEMQEVLEDVNQLHTRADNASRKTQRLHEQVQELRRHQQQFYRPAGTEIAEAVQECDLL